jgi:hypothetical protein
MLKRNHLHWCFDFVPNIRELTSCVNIISSSTRGSEDMARILPCSKTLKDHKRRIEVRHDLSLLLQEDIGIHRHWKHECHCDYLESHNKVTCLTKWCYIQKSMHQSYCHIKEENFCFYFEMWLFRRKDWWHHSSWYQSDNPRYIRMTLVEQCNNLVPSTATAQWPVKICSKQLASEFRSSTMRKLWSDGGQLLHGAFKAVCTNSFSSEIHLLVHIHQWNAHSLATLRKSWKFPDIPVQHPPEQTVLGGNWRG